MHGPHGHYKSPINVPYKSQKGLINNPKRPYGYPQNGSMINQLVLPFSQLFARRLHSSSAAFARNLEKLVDETMMEAENARKNVDF